MVWAEQRKKNQQLSFSFSKKIITSHVDQNLALITKFVEKKILKKIAKDIIGSKLQMLYYCLLTPCQKSYKVSIYIGLYGNKKIENYENPTKYWPWTNSPASSKLGQNFESYFNHMYNRQGFEFQEVFTLVARLHIMRLFLPLKLNTVELFTT